jgi:hypothetical protein
LKKSLIFYLFFSVFVSAQSQVEIDTHSVDSTVISDRYVDHSNQLLLKVMSVVKSNNLQLINNENSQSIMLKPYGISSLGFGFNYKWLGLGIAFGLPATPEEKARFGKTTRFDFQLNIYSKKFVIDAFLQQYRGYYIANPIDYIPTWNDSIMPQLPTMETASASVGGYYVFNHKKLSYKAAYVRNAIQKKSAGSFLLGGFYSIDYAGFPTGDTAQFVPTYFSQESQDSLPFNAYRSISAGISFGYTYTFVFWKKFFMNFSFIPGVGSKSLIIYKNGQAFIERSAAGRFNGRFAMGFESRHIIIGLTSNTITGNFEFQHYQLKPSTSNLKFFIAKRFNLKKKK